MDFPPTRLPPGAAGRSGFVRVEVRRSDGRVVALTNPILVR
ncbi:hypothetical protein OU787_02100 [Kitasatospora sp. YST-16]|nr:hypothetical protein [Kitasatospora sp. YST-16]WAL70388.1 hypothetical protein OU787_02100 [Kitasatospora sp. YST-16]WNW36429.1 hypothetical protein RKE32_02105 [Streptomyces sp. Li-HN-5-13]